MTTQIPYGLFQSASQINQNVQHPTGGTLTDQDRLAESATAVLMNQSEVDSGGVMPRQQQQSIMLDNGEYFFDDDFSVPFDANLREENNNLGGEGGGRNGPDGERGNNFTPRMVTSRSDSCLYRAAVEFLARQGETEDDDLDDDEDDVVSDEPLFPPEASVTEGQGSAYSMRLSGSSTDQQRWAAAIGGSLRGRLNRPIPSSDYKLTFGSSQITSQHRGQTNSSDKDPGASISGFSQASSSSGSNLSTWATLARDRLPSPSTSCDVITSPLPRDEPPCKKQTTTNGKTTATTASGTTWKQMKQAASSQFVSWRELKQIVKPAETPRETGCGHTNGTVSQMIGPCRPANQRQASQEGGSDGCSTTVVLRSQTTERRGHRYSGTLLELYKRAHSMDLSFRSIEAEDEGHKKPGHRQNQQRWFNHLFTNNSLSISSELDQRAALDSSICRQVAHFGAQFPSPPVLVGERPQQQRSHSLAPLRPGQRIAYPGLGVLAVPRSSRLSGPAFLSRTLPDLSFLAVPSSASHHHTNSSHHHHKRPSSAPPKPPRRSSSANQTSGDSGFESTNDGGQPSVCRNDGGQPSVCRKCGCNVGHSPSEDDNTVSQDTTTAPSDTAPPGSPLIKHMSVPDLVTQDLRGFLAQEEAPPLKSCLARPRNNSLDQAEEEYDEEYDEQQQEFLEVHTTPGCLTNSRGSMDSADDGGFKAKKSVSFSEKILFHTPTLGEEPGGIGCLFPGAALRTRAGPVRPRPMSLVSDLRVIPRDCGLYGQDPPLAQFQLPSPEADAPSEEPKKSDIDLRYHALVNDVIKSVQQAVAFFSARCDVLTGAGPGNSSCLNISSSVGSEDSASTTTGGGASPLGLIAPLTTLVMDGILAPTRQLFGSKQRSKLWILVEESCRPGVANRVLTEVFNEVKTLPSHTADKIKFRAFVCACLNAKALSMWLSSVVQSESILKRYYCEDAFLRRCRSGQRELYADLTTSLEMLLNLPFRIDVASQARPKSANSSSASASGQPIRARHDIRPASAPSNRQQAAAVVPPPLPAHGRATRPTALSTTVKPQLQPRSDVNKPQGRFRTALSSVRQKTDGYFKRSSSNASTPADGSPAPAPKQRLPPVVSAPLATTTSTSSSASTSSSSAAGPYRLSRIPPPQLSHRPLNRGHLPPTKPLYKP